MTTYSIIQKSQLEGALRLDAEYYRPKYLDSARDLKSLRSQPLSSLTTKIDVGFVSSMADHFQEIGVPLLRTQNVKEFYVDLGSDVAHIDEEFHNKLKKTQIHPGNVLIARSGSIGNACIVPKELTIANSADIVLIESKTALIPEYLVAFLNSRYGQFQIERGVSGGLQGHINLSTLENLLVPVVTISLQNEIRDAVLEGLGYLKQSQALYSQAEGLLLEELGLAGVEFADELSFVVKASEAEAAGRADSDYFQPKYIELLDTLNKYGAAPLTEIVESVPAKFNPKATPDREFSYVALADVDPSLGIINNSSEILGNEAPSRAKRVLKKGDVVISSVRGSLEKVALVGSGQEGYLASTGFFQLRGREILSEALLVLAKSLILQLQLEQRATGTILSAVPQNAITDVVIPTLPQPTQQKIAEMVRQSHQARRESQRLLEQAKRKVEELVERGW